MSGIPAPATGVGPPAVAGCGGMMGCMGVGAKPFYPALMDMPALTPEARRFIEAEAAKRLSAGSEAITAGQAPLQQAISSNDTTAMQKAIEGVRVGALLAESGAAALQAVNEGQPPRKIALTWFKSQLGTPDADGMQMADGPWGLSWYHLTLMGFLLAFLLGTVMLHYARLRRIGALVQRLTPGMHFASGSAKHPAPPAAPAPPPLAPVSDRMPKRPWSGSLRVAAIFDETPTVKTFRLMCPDGGAIPFTFLPGQFLTFAAEVDGKPIRRSYTIASAPTQRDYVEVTVKREEQGAESRYLHDHVAIGDQLAMTGPAGVFTFTGTETDSVVLIAGGVGITPMMCVIRTLTDHSFPGDIFLVYGARTTQDFIFREELEYLRKRHGNLHVAATMSQAEGTAWTGAQGPVSKAFIAQAVPDIARRRVHVCGPPPMMVAVKAALLELGVPLDKIRTEAFGPAKGAAPMPAAGLLPLAAAAHPAVAAGTAAISSAQSEIQFSRSGKTGPLAPDQSVLEAAEAIGVAIDFSCRVGTCGVCAVPLLEGAVAMEVEDGLPPQEKARGMILACQAKSAGFLVVDA